MTRKQKITNLLKEAGYHEDELLMDDFFVDGEVKTAREWAADALAANEFDDFFRHLVEVQWDEKERGWVRIEF